MSSIFSVTILLCETAEQETLRTEQQSVTEAFLVLPLRNTNKSYTIKMFFAVEFNCSHGVEEEQTAFDR